MLSPQPLEGGVWIRNYDNMWKPISINGVLTQISNTENDLEAELYKFWKLVKIYPEKWQEEEYGKDSRGFWAVGIYGENVIW
ncbi:MAG: hypothetical protein JWQ63_93 [Mucilaginibacter sp.]|nr:hypothetical protein [Mucilaginibacter sp.]